MSTDSGAYFWVIFLPGLAVGYVAGVARIRYLTRCRARRQVDELARRRSRPDGNPFRAA